MSPLQRIAMGLVIVVLSAPLPADPSPSWRQYDVLADPFGWLLVIAGTFALARLDRGFATVRLLALLAGAASVVLWFPQVSHLLEDSGAWAASLPQIAFCLLLCREIGVRAGGRTPPDHQAERRFGLLVWGFVLVAVLPVIALGGDVVQLQNATAVVSMLVNLALIWSLFGFHRREWLGGPGPLEVQPRRPGTQESRPPSQ
jgi:hypothetical protein